MLKLILIMILILGNLVHCVDDAETYSDEMPKKTLIFQQDILKEYNFDEKHIEIQLLKKNFLDKGYQELPLDLYMGDDYAVSHGGGYKTSSGGRALFYCFVNLKSKEHRSFFIDISHNKELGAINIQYNPLPMNKKWNYPITRKYWGGNSKTVKEMSWQNVDLVIHHHFQMVGEEGQIFKNNLYKKFYKDIVTFGFEECISRILITKEIGKYNYYSLSNSNTEAEKINNHFHAPVQFNHTSRSFCNVF